MRTRAGIAWEPTSAAGPDAVPASPDRSRCISPPLDKAYYREAIARLRAVGFNWLRFHTSVPSEPYMQAADELGMMIQMEAPEGFEEPEWIDILKACRTHPCVVIYCCGNEQRLDDGRIEFLARMAQRQKDIVPDALFNPHEALRGVEYCWNPEDFGERVVSEPYPHTPHRLERLKEFSDCFGQYAWGHLSYESTRADVAACLAAGVLAVGPLELGGPRPAGTLSVTAPPVDRPRAVTLTVRLVGGAYDLTNQWRMWVFPEVNALDSAPAPIRIVEDLGTPDIDALEAGADLVLIRVPRRAGPSAGLHTRPHVRRSGGTLVQVPHPALCEQQRVQSGPCD